jgi:D-alanyl-D-alanine carboxypeptidase
VIRSWLRSDTRDRGAWLALVLLWPICASATSLGAASTPPGDPAGAIRELAEAAMQQHQAPGLAVAVLREDQLIYAGGFGLAALEPATPVTATSVFQLGSISKQFLAALVLLLAEDDRLSLDDPVALYLPDFAHLPESVTVRGLLNHTSGLRELFALPEADEGMQNLERSVAELRAAVRRAPLDFPAGARWSYSNTGYTLLAFIVEELTGLPYHQALAERLFTPLELTSLHHCRSLPVGPEEARGHTLDGTLIVASPPENMNWAWGDGGLCGNVLDLARWTRLLHKGAVLKPHSWREMTSATRLHDGREIDYGFALSLVALDDVPSTAHNGLMFGYSARAAYYPTAGLTLAVLVNRGGVESTAIERGTARRLLGLPAPAFEACATSPAVLERLVGRYDIGVFEVEVLPVGGALRLESPPPGPSTMLRCIAEGEFIGAGGPDATHIRFTPGEGAANELRLFMAGMHWYGTRVPPGGSQ